MNNTKRDARVTAEWKERIARCRLSWVNYPKISREVKGKIMVGNVDRLSESDFRKVYLQRKDCRSFPPQAYWSYFFMAMVGFYDKAATFESEQAMLNACAVKARNWLGSAELRQTRGLVQKTITTYENGQVVRKTTVCQVIGYMPNKGLLTFSDFINPDDEREWMSFEERVSDNQPSPEELMIKREEHKDVRQILDDIYLHCDKKQKSAIRAFLEDGANIGKRDIIKLTKVAEVIGYL